MPTQSRRIQDSEVPECCKRADLREILCPRCDGYGYPGDVLRTNPERVKCEACNGLGSVANPLHEWHDKPLSGNPNAIYRRMLDARRKAEKEAGLPPSRAALRKSQQLRIRG